MSLRLAIVEPAATGAALLLGEHRVDLDDANERAADEKPFDLEAKRTGGHLSVLLDGQLVHEKDIGDAAIGRFGLAPDKARLRVFRFSVRGRLDPLPGRSSPPDFQPAIEAAIDRGVAWLLPRQLRDGSWQNSTASFPEGQTALATYALLRAGLSTEHPAVARALAHLCDFRDFRPTETYPAALMLMALEATREPRWRDAMRPVVADLLAWQSSSGWSYAPARRANAVYADAVPHTDLSNSQYAVLGLRAAQHAGVEVQDEAWARALAAALALQESPNEIEIPREDKKSGTRPVSIAGFRYRGDREVTGSMTSAGCAVVEVCRTALGQGIKAQTAQEAARALELGRAWLDAHFNLEENFGSLEPQNFYCYLYGLERVGTLLEVESFGGHAWYSEGAEKLLKLQGADGSWVVGGYASTEWREIPAEHDTCFAILFMKRASRPTVRTGEAPPEIARKPSDLATLLQWMMPAASGPSRNLLLAQPVAASASSVNVPGQEAEKALDGRESTLWVCAGDDGEPSLVLEWKKPIQADFLVLNGACSRRADLGKYDRIRRVRVTLDKRKDSFDAGLTKDEIEPTRVRLPKSVQLRRIEIRIIEREAGGEWKGHAGFTEVALER